MLGDAVRYTEEKAVYSWNQYLWRQSSFTDAEEESEFLEWFGIHSRKDMSREESVL